MKGEVRGIVLWQKDYREKDKLVKIFTESYGTLVFFVRDVRKKNVFLSSYIQPGTQAIFIGDFRREGLSFLNDAKNKQENKQTMLDFSLNAHVLYLLQLVEAVLEEKEADIELFDFTKTFLLLLEEGGDKEILTNIFEMQLLNRFGVALDLSTCTICGEEEGLFDFSFRQHGLICQKHFLEEKNRAYLNPQLLALLRIFQEIPYEKIGKITVKKENKEALQQFIDEIYKSYVGIHLKGKKFIQQMNAFEATIKKPPAD